MAEANAQQAAGLPASLNHFPLFQVVPLPLRAARSLSGSQGRRRIVIVLIARSCLTLLRAWTMVCELPRPSYLLELVKLESVRSGDANPIISSSDRPSSLPARNLSASGK